MTDGRELVNGVKGWQSQTTPMGGIAMAETSKGGLTKRELFAAMAMARMTDVPNGNMELKAVSIAQCAVIQADALIAELNKEQAT